MAKGQKRSNKEVKKPKAVKPKVTAAASNVSRAFAEPANKGSKNSK